MPAFSTNIQKLLYYDPDQARSTVSTFTEDIQTANAESSFTIFLMAEIRTEEHSKNQYFLRELQNEFSKFFKSLNSRITESSFEEGLHQLNKIIPTLIKDRLPSFTQSITFVAGAISRNVIHFSQVGPATILFVQNGAVFEIGEHVALSTQNPLKLFKEIASGKIEPGDIIFVSTTNFLDYFSQEKIKRLLEEHAEESLTKGFDEFLSKAPLTTSFAALSITMQPDKITTVKELTEQPAQQQTSPSYSHSMETLIEREQNTEDIMSPKLLPFLKHKLKVAAVRLRAAIRKYVLKKPSRVSPIITEKQETEVPLRYSHQGTKKSLLKARGAASKTLSRVSRGISKLVSQASEGSRLLLNSKKQPSPESIPLAPAVRSKENPVRVSFFMWFKQLSRQRKTLFVAAIILVAIFAQSIVINGVLQQRADKKNIESALEAQIQKSTDDINAALVYGDDNRIRNSIDELKQELASLQNTKGNDDLIQKVQEAIAQGEKRLQKIRIVDSPQVLADIGSSLGSGKITHAIVIDNTFLLLNPQNKSVITIDITSGDNAAHSAVTSENQAPLLIASVGPSAYILNQKLSLSRYNSTTDAIAPASFTPPADTANLAAIASYSNRLYFIDINTNQILKSLPIKNGYSRPTAWLSANEDLSSADSIAIDGSIYIGFRNGTIKKFTRGAEDSFPMEQINPTLDNIDALWTDETTSTLYVLDSKGSRVLAINKNNGNLLQQIVISNIGTIESFGISETDQVIALVSGSTVYKVPMADN